MIDMPLDLPVPAEPQLKVVAVVVVVDVGDESNEPLLDTPGGAKLTAPEVFLQVIDRGVAPAGPLWATAVTAVAPMGMATAAAIKSIFRSMLLAPFRSPA